MVSSQDFDFIYKVITAGDGGVGKTTMLQRYIDDKFTFDTKLTVGVEISEKTIDYFNKYVIGLQIWDFGGQERFRFLLDSFVKGAKGALLLFDLTRVSALIYLNSWVDIIRKYDNEVPILLVGSKADLEEDISINDEDVLELMSELNCIGYIKTSSKTGQNVGRAFEILIYKILEKFGKTTDSLEEAYTQISESLL